MTDLKHTSLYEVHTGLGARMVGFGGWSMPLSYQSQIEEHHAVRRRAGMFDVSHMTIVDASGAGVEAYLRRVLANDVMKLDTPGDSVCRALYSCLLAEDGGILDDLIVYRLAAGSYRLIINAATREKDLDWLTGHARDASTELVERADLAMLAVQGPQAREAVAGVIPESGVLQSLAPFAAAQLGRALVARTGYTGEDGFEVMVPGEQAPGLWRELQAREVVPCGLGARDTLRLEAGLNLYGLDMDESVTPLECGLKWTVAFGGDRDFIGRQALEGRLASGLTVKQVGLVLEGRGVLRAGYPVKTAAGDGIVTSGTFSPTLGRAIALARVPSAAKEDCEVLIRGRSHVARIVRPPFVRNGEIKVKLDHGND